MRLNRHTRTGCSLPLKGTQFGILVTTGDFKYVAADKGHRRLHLEVMCPHKHKKFIAASGLKCGDSTSCSHWDECNIPLKGTKYGTLVTTGSFKYMVGRLWLEVRCPCGNKKFVTAAGLKNGNNTSHRHWRRCHIPLKGIKYGKLTSTGISKYVDGRLQLEVKCPCGNKNFLSAKNLKRGISTSCVKWNKCHTPTKNIKYGELTTTGRFSYINELYYEVKCLCGNKNFVREYSLKNGQSTSCKSWECCGFNPIELNEIKYIRTRVPKVCAYLSKIQNKICSICGNQHYTTRLDSIDHHISINCIIQYKMSLKRREAVANSIFNLFAAHKRCNSVKSSNSVEEFWKKYPECEVAARKARTFADKLKRNVNLLQ